MAKICGLEMAGLIKDGQECWFVPIQKITVGVLMKAAEWYCEECGKKRCDKCCLHTAIERAKWTMQLDPCFDEDFNVVGSDVSTENQNLV